MVGALSWSENVLYVCRCGRTYRRSSLTSVIFVLLANYADDLSKLVNKMLRLCEVAALARDIRSETARPDAMQRNTSVTQFGISREDFNGMLRYDEHEDDTSSNLKSIPNRSAYEGGFIVDPTLIESVRQGALDQSQKEKITELLGAWYVSISDVFGAGSCYL